MFVEMTVLIPWLVVAHGATKATPTQRHFDEQKRGEISTLYVLCKLKVSRDYTKDQFLL